MRESIKQFKREYWIWYYSSRNEWLQRDVNAQHKAYRQFVYALNK